MVEEANKQSSTTSTILKMADVANFAVLLKNALLDPGTAEAFRAALEPLISKQTSDISNELAGKVKGLEAKVSKQSTELMSLKRQVDQLQQQERRNSVRITGIDKPQPVPGSGMPISRTCKLAVQTMLREKMGIDVDDRDLEDAYTVGPPDKNRSQTMIVRFSSNSVKMNIMQLRAIKLKGSTPPIYINDDLTKKRADLFKKARQDTKDGILHAVWTRNGSIFTKKTSDSSPVEIFPLV